VSLQVTRQRKRAWLWKRGVEQPGAIDRALLDATTDDRDAHALAERAIHEDRGTVVAAVAGMALWWSMIIGVAEAPGRDRQLAIGFAGGGLALGGFATAIVLALHGARDQARAIDTYNVGCRR
jgi:hypothetical protein